MMISATCEGRRCFCDKRAVKKVGEEIPFDDPMPARHNLTAYVCAAHYAELMGPVGAQQVGYTRIEPVSEAEIDAGIEAILAKDDTEVMLDELRELFGADIDVDSRFTIAQVLTAMEHSHRRAMELVNIVNRAAIQSLRSEQEGGHD